MYEGVELEPVERRGVGESSARYPQVLVCLLLLCFSCAMLFASAWYARPFLRKLKTDISAFKTEKVDQKDLSLTQLNLQELQALQFAFAQTHKGQFIVQYFPGWQANDFRSITSDDTLFKKVADSTPPPGQVWSYTAANKSITKAYESLLDDIRLVAEQAGHVRRNRQELVQTSEALHQSLRTRTRPQSREQRQDFDALVSQLFAGVPSVPEAAAAWKAYRGRAPGPPVYLSDPDRAFISGTTQNNVTERRLTYNGIASAQLSDEPLPFNVPIQVFAGEYRVIEFERAPWFNLDLIRQAQGAAAFVPTFQKYFGTEGALSRIAAGAILVRENGFVLEADMSGAVGTNLCDNPARNLTFAVRNARVTVACNEAQKIGKDLVWVVPPDQAGTPKIVGMVVEAL